MAYTFNGSLVNTPTSDIPSGYVKPSPTTFTDWEYKRVHSITVTKSGVENADAATTYGAIVTDVNSQLTTELTDDFDSATDSFEGFAKIELISLNSCDDEKYTNVAQSYTVSVTSFTKRV